MALVLDVKPIATSASHWALFDRRTPSMLRAHRINVRGWFGCGHGVVWLVCGCGLKHSNRRRDFFISDLCVDRTLFSAQPHIYENKCVARRRLTNMQVLLLNYKRRTKFLKNLVLQTQFTERWRVGRVPPAGCYETGHAIVGWRRIEKLV